MHGIRLKVKYLSLLGALALLLSIGATLFANASTATAATNIEYFPQTGFTLSGKFLDYWNAHGGLPVFGYPITSARLERDPSTGEIFLSQWFERNRFEYHPELAGTPYEVEMGLLGREVTQGRENETPFKPTSSSAVAVPHTYFSETQHNVLPVFMNYWNAHGGLSQFGYPISESFQEKNPSDGKTYMVQYFERARFEYHPEFANTPYLVELGLLGNQLVSLGNISSYVDDRSTPESTIMSLYNAINSKQYVRAYSYFDPNSPSTPAFNQFQTGYNNTDVVQAIVGTAGTDVGAGQIYSNVPVVLKATTSNGQLQTFQDCYTTHLAQPVIQDNPPFDPIQIESSTGKQVSNDSDVINLLTHACDTTNGGSYGVKPETVYPSFAPSDISSKRYVDDRSNGLEVVRSLYNAINSNEYDRAYSYFATPGQSYSQFKQGYANTVSVQLTTGTVTSNAGAGQRYDEVPVGIKATNKDGSVQTFVGCYTSHLGSPDAQATVPFQPLNIYSAKIQQVPNNANLSTLINQACH